MINLESSAQKGLDLGRDNRLQTLYLCLMLIPMLACAHLQTSNQAAAKSSLPAPHRPRSGPVGPASYSTQVALSRPPGPAFDVRSLDPIPYTLGLIAVI